MGFIHGSSKEKYDFEDTMEIFKIAKEFTDRKVDYEFTATEKYWLDKFFSNTDKNIFAFHQTVPDVVKSYSLARYSRIKNPRGLRGILLQDVIPHWIISKLPEYEDYDVTRLSEELKSKNVASVDGLDADDKFGHKAYFAGCQILNALGQPAQVADLAKDDKLKKLFNTYVDGYGHNSIVRTGSISLCFENISIIVDKILQWCRFGAPIELSTRYVDFAKKEYFPIYRLFEVSFPSVAPRVKKHLDGLFELYGWQMDRQKGFQKFLEETWVGKMPPGFNLEAGIFGESCDVLGNFLPGATLTSMGLTVSGEGLSDVIKHLLLEPVAEARAVAQAIIREVEIIGASSYIRHIDSSSEWRIVDWDELIFDADKLFIADSNRFAKYKLLKQFKGIRKFVGCSDFNQICAEFSKIKREDFDKLMHQFESVNVLMRKLISFRTFRDLQRHTQSTTSRSLVTPLNGFYKYPKPISDHLKGIFRAVARDDFKLWTYLRDSGISANDLEYVLAMGNNVVFEMSHNLRQHELVVKTRSKYDVNDEARSWMLDFERKVRKQYPWYAQLSRADMTPHYVFARGADEKKGIFMPKL